VPVGGDLSPDPSRRVTVGRPARGGAPTSSD